MTLFATPARADDGAWSVHSPAGVPIQDLAATAAQAGRLYATSRGGGVYRSDDGGDTWTAINGGLTNLDINVVAASPLDPALVIAAQVDGALQVSTDAGATWTAGVGGAVGTVSAIAFDPLDDDVVFALDGQSVLRSADRGATWSRESLGATLNAVAFAPGQPAVYVGADTGLFESTDGGATWTDLAGSDEVFGGWPFGNSRIAALVEDADTFSVILLAAEDTGTEIFRMPSAGSSFPGGDAASRDAMAAAEHFAFDLTSEDPYLGRALLAGPHGIHGSVNAGALGDLATEFYGGANYWLPLNEGLPAAAAGGYAVTALMFDPTTARRYFAVVDGAVMRYDGKIGADLRLGGRQVDGFDDPALMSPICCTDTDDGGKRLDVMFTLRNHSAEMATDVEFRFTVDPPVPFSVAFRDQSATVMPFECSEISSREKVCVVEEFPRGWAEGSAGVVAHEAGDYKITATVTAAERDPTPGSNSATQMYSPEFPEADVAAEAPDSAAEDEPPPAAEDPGDIVTPADEPGEVEPPAEAADDVGDAEPPADESSDDEPPAQTNNDTGSDGGSNPAPDAASETGGAGSWHWMSLAALSFLVGARRRRRARAHGMR